MSKKRKSVDCDIIIYQWISRMLKKISDKTKFDLSQFGLVFVLFFLVLHFASKSGHNLFIYMAIAFLVVTLFFYRVLVPLDRLWRKLGDIFGRIISSLILGVVFYIMLPLLHYCKGFYGIDLWI
jgi:hypothetical protein